MKFFNKVSKKVVTITIDSENIICGHFREIKNKVYIENYYRFLIEKFEIHNLNIFNQIKIQNLIKKFLSAYDLKSSFVYLSLSGNQIKDKIVTTDKQFQSGNHLLTQNENFITNIYKVNENKNKNFFYIANISHTLLFQYKIFAINSQINLLKILPENIVIIRLFQLLKPDFNFSLINEIDFLKKYFNEFIESCDINQYILTLNPEIDLKREKKFILRNFSLIL